MQSLLDDDGKIIRTCIILTPTKRNNQGGDQYLYMGMFGSCYPSARNDNDDEAAYDSYMNPEPNLGSSTDTN